MLQDAARVGLLSAIGGGHVPDPPGAARLSRRRLARPGTPAATQEERQASEQALRAACAAFSQWLTGQIESGDAAFAYTLIGLQRRTLGAMLGHALDHHAWEGRRGYCPGAG